MLIVLVLMYFLLACFAGWLLVFPSGREALLVAMANFGPRWNRRLRRLNRGGASGAAALHRSSHSTLARCRRFVRRHRWLSLAATALITLPPVLVLVFGEGNMLDDYDSDSRPINAQVSELLRGEQLAPPPVPPPLVFATLEVEQLRPLLVSASRNWLLLDDDFRRRLWLLFKIMRERHGYDMALLEGYRSPERQNLLAAAGPGVTNAKAFQSYHQYGLAADCAFLRDGKLLISEKDPWAMRGYRLYGEEAEALGLRWGGRWAMMDFGHTELRPPRGKKK